MPHSQRKKRQPPFEPTLSPSERLLLLALKKASPDTLNLAQLLQRTGLHEVVTDDEAHEMLGKLIDIGSIIAETSYRYSLAEEKEKKPKEYEVKQELVLPKTQSTGSQELIGKLEFLRDGGAQVIVPGHEQPYKLSQQEPLRAFHGDTVRIRLSTNGHPEAQLVTIMQRVRDAFVGTLELHPRGAYFIPQESRIKPDFVISRKALMGAQDGDKVQVRLLGWSGKNPEGEVVRVLGGAGEHSAEMHAIILEFGLDTDYPEAVTAAAATIPAKIDRKEIAKRKDFRNVLTFTIDPLDAKDFDDAISFQRLEDGIVEVGVHIADVSHYVQEGTVLDQEAFHRATSVYLVDRTIPMLPERLSNDLCSLRPHEDRLVFSAVFKLDAEANILSEWFGRGIIHSDRRFTYEEAQAVLETHQGDHAEELLELNRLAYALRKERFAQGSINFETEEVKFRLDENFRPVEVYRKVRKDAHKLVEDFMLLANRRVAQFIAEYRKKPTVPMVYRIHDVPAGEKLNNLRSFVSSFGYQFEIGDQEKVARSMNRLVTESTGTPEEALLQSVAIRSMPKAIYTTQNIGHYGLGFAYYTHFTSPIRRYPDLLVHRILQHVLDKDLKLDEVALELMAKHCSEREKRAADAERASIKYKQVEYLQVLLGQEFDGIISGVTDWGIYVELEQNKCEGMIPLRELKDDHYQLDEKTYTLKGKRSGRTFRLGDRLRVQVKKTNLVKRTADFKFIAKLS